MAISSVEEGTDYPRKTESLERVAPGALLNGIDPATRKTIGTVTVTSEERIPDIVFCGNPERAERIANRLKAGTVDINEAIVNYVIAALPFGGLKRSGINRYHGKVGLRLFSAIKAMVISDAKQNTEPYWFPYSEATLTAVKESLR